MPAMVQPPLKTLEQPVVSLPAATERRDADRATSAAWIMPVHMLAASLIMSTWMAVQFILPILVRKVFHASSWQTVMVTAAPTVLSVLSIFWSAALSGRRLPSYLSVYWLIMGVPLAMIGRATSYWELLIPHIISCIGAAGYHPVAGDLLRSLYPERVRGRMYSWVWGGSMLLGAAAGYVMGEVLKHDEGAFRAIMPVAAGLQLLGVATLLLLSHKSGHAALRTARLATRDRSSASQGLGKLLEPIVNMGGILRADPTFARYEAAFMTYGVGWMIVYALAPLMLTGYLHLNYDSIVESTYVPYWLAMTAMIVPAGMLMDRLGPARSTAISFLMLAGHPLGLLLALAAGEHAYLPLLMVSSYYGIAHAGANIGWMLGPVALAPSQEKVPQYVAIHATMVGIRGTIFQVLGVGLYELSGSFTVPLVVAALAYTWSAWQMWALRRRMPGRTSPRADGARP